MEKIWKEVQKVNFSNCEELLKELKKNNYKVSPWIEDIVKKNNYKFTNNKFSSTITLITLRLRALTFAEPV